MDESGNAIAGLDRVTLCAITSRDASLTEVALLRSAQALPFGRVVMFSPVRPASESIEHVEIQAFSSVEDYSRFILFGLGEHIRSEFALIIHFDGFVIHPKAWDQKFLQYDYIGARWPWHPDKQVGNGGFCLRSLRLLKATANPRFNRPGIPEDELICRTERDYLESEFGVRFAPPEEADRFSMEHAGRPLTSFGFHGLFHLHQAYQDKELDDVMLLMNPSVYAGASAVQWFLALLNQGGHRILGKLARAILEAQPSSILSRNCAIFGISPLEVALALGRSAAYQEVIPEP